MKLSIIETVSSYFDVELPANKTWDDVEDWDTTEDNGLEFYR